MWILPLFLICAKVIYVFVGADVAQLAEQACNQQVAGIGTLSLSNVLIA